MSPRLLRWGICGTGTIAKVFAKDLIQHTSDINQLTGVVSRSSAKASAFLTLNRLPVSAAYTDFDAFAKNVDVCYIATPHTTHVDMALQCLRRGVNVLVEKPFALNRQELERVFELAEQRGLFVMEAVWTRFIPAMKRIVDAVQSGAIGDVVSIDVDFGFDGSDGPARLMDPALAGGALYDLGTYGFHLGTLLSGLSSNSMMPKVLHTSAKKRADGVDEVFNVVLAYPSQTGEDMIMRMRLSVVEETSCTAFIRGKQGYVVIERPFHSPDSFIINGQRQEVKRIGHGLHYQTKEVHTCIQQGRLESKSMPWKESLNWAQTFSDISAFDAHLK